MDNDPKLEPLSRPATEYFEPAEEEHIPNSDTDDAVKLDTLQSSSKTSSDFFSSNSDGREMLDLIDSLRDVAGINKTIPLPQIVVVGQQSCGKSSVLHAISGINFPRNEDLTTQFPIEIVLRRTNYTQTKVSFRPSNDKDPNVQQALDAFEKEWKSIELTLDQLPDVIASAKRALNFNEINCFSNEVLLLEVCGPKQEQLTLIDLPGFIYATEIEQDSKDIERVDKMVCNYMNNDRAILLTVFTCGMDFANQTVMEKLKHNAKYRGRALGVLTAPDRVVSSIQTEKLRQYYENTRLPLHYGWHLLRNLDSEQEREGMARDVVEKHFFETTSPWCEIDKDHVGSQALKQRLSRFLLQKIAQALPAIEKQVECAIQDCQHQLNSLGSERLTTDQQKAYLFACGKQFERALSEALGGNPQLGQLRTEEVSLRARLRCMGEEYCDTMNSQGRSWRLNPNLECVHAEISNQRFIQDAFFGDRDSTEKFATRELPEADVFCWLSKLIRGNQGLELPNLVNPHWAGVIFESQSRRWESLAKKYLDNVFAVVKEYVVEMVENNYGGQVSTKVLQILVLPSLRIRKDELDKKLKELCKPYSGRYPQTLSRRLFQILQTTPSTEDDISLLDDPEGCVSSAKCRLLLKTVDAVYDICSEIFVDNIQNLAVESCLLDDIHTIANEANFYDLDIVDLENLAGESKEDKAKRERLTKGIKQYDEARDSILVNLAAKAREKRSTLNATSAFDLHNPKAIVQSDVAKEQVMIKQPIFQSKERDGTLRGLTPSTAEAVSSTATTSVSFPNPNTDLNSDSIFKPVRNRLTPRTTPMKTRRRNNVIDSTDQSCLSDSESHGVSPPLSTFSSASGHDTASTTSSFQNSPQPTVKTSGLKGFNPRWPTKNDPFEL